MNAYGFFKDSDEILVPSLGYRALYKCSLIDKSVEFLYEFISDTENKYPQILDVVSFENKKLFFSQNSYEFWEYEKDIKKIKYLDYSVNKISKVSLCGEYVYVFSSSLINPIYCLSMRDYTVQELKWNNNNELGTGNIISCFCDDKKIYTASREKNNIYIIRINCINQKIDHFKLTDVTYINAVAVYDEVLWALCRNQNGKDVLRKYNLENTELIDEIQLYLIDPIDSALINYSRIINFNEMIFLIPCMSSEVVVYDIKTKTEKIIYLPDNFEFDEVLINKIKFTKAYVEDNYIYIISPSSSDMLKINMLTLEVVTIKWNISLQDRKRKVQFLLYDNQKVIESTEFTLEDFINNI